MAEQRLEMHRELDAAMLLFPGYGFYKAAMLDSYVTVFGIVDNPVGYVSNLLFMLAASASIVLTALWLVVSRKGPCKPFGIPIAVPFVLLASGYVAGMLISEPGPAAFIVLGLAWGFATTLATIAFTELFAYEESPVAVVLQLSFAAFFSAVLTLALNSVAPIPKAGTYLLLIAVSWAVLHSGRRTLDPYAVDRSDWEDGRSFTLALRTASMPIIAYMIFEMALGLLNMFATAGHSTLVIASGAPMWGMLACSALMTVLVVLSKNPPNMRLMGLVAFPVAIAVLLLLPFVGGEAGRALSVAVYAAYIFTTTMSLFFYITACRTVKADICRVAAVVHLGSRMTLTLGLVAGYCLASVQDGEPFVQTGIVVVASAYILLAVVVFWNFRAGRSVAVRQGPKTTDPAADAIAPVDRLEELASEYRLTKRERDVYGYLIKGGTAKSIANELGISPYTVQGYIQKLYGKLGVNKKEQALSIYYER